jgi:hypothetical protein
MRCIFILVFGTLSISYQAYAQRTERMMVPSRDSLERTTVPQDTLRPIESLPSVQLHLSTFKQMITEENYRQMGFESPGEISVAKIEPPIYYYLVRLNRLKLYKPGNQPDYLLMLTGQLIFPVSVNGHIRSSMTLRKSWGRWKALTFGNSDFVKQLTDVILQSSQRYKVPHKDFFAVGIPALNIIVAGYRKKNTLYVVPLTNDKSLRYRAKESISAERFFTIILRDALAHDGLPR